MITGVIGVMMMPWKLTVGHEIRHALFMQRLGSGKHWRDFLSIAHEVFQVWSHRQTGAPLIGGPHPLPQAREIRLAVGGLRNGRGQVRLAIGIAGDSWRGGIEPLGGSDSSRGQEED